MSILNLDALKTAAVHNQPYPYALFDYFLNTEYQQRLWEDFPDISQRGSYALSSVNLKKGLFADLLKELESSELREIIAKKFDLDLANHPPLITLRAHSTERDGLIHKDTKSKVVTVLIYLNPAWPEETGKLRVLYDNKNLTPYAAEVTPIFGNCLIFKVTDNCWHGYVPYVGVRRSIQLNYVQSGRVVKAQQWRHAFSAFFKKLFKKDACPTC